MNFLSAVVSWSLSNRAIVLLGTFLLAAMGVVSATRLPIDAVPDVTTMQVQIITSVPALSPVEVEQYVSTPVERAMSGIPHMTEVRSISKYGLSVVTVVFTDDTNIYFARQMVAERMAEAIEAVPSQYGKPVMGPISSGLGEIYQFVLRGEGHSLMELEELLDWYIGPQLRSVPGIVEVNSFGGENKEYQVVADPKRLQAQGLSIGDVVSAIERTNANAGGGYIEHNREQLVIGTDGLVKNLDDLNSVVVGATAQGVPITVANIGEAKFGPQLRRGAASMDGKGEVVVGVALMLMGENSRVVTHAVKEKLAALATSLPPGVRIEGFYDRSDLVNRTIRTVFVNLAEGAALVILVLLLLLGDLRAGVIVAVTIPLSMLFAIIVMQATGASGNLMSLGAIDFGLIVDGAVIIVENAVRRLGEARRKQTRQLTAEERTAVVGQAAVEVRSASVFGEFIIAIVYVPILALRGIEGKLFTPMARTVLFALLGAFILSLTLVPVLCSFLLRASEREHETWLMRAAHRIYRWMLPPALRHRKLVVVLGAITVLVTTVLFTRIGAEFVPKLDEGDILVEARRLPGVALSESIATDKRLQQAILSVPEIRHAVSKTGSPELATDPMGIEQTDVYIQTAPRADWRPGVSKAQLLKEIGEALEQQVPEVASALSQPIEMRTNELISGARSDVAVRVFGPDLERLATLAEQVRGVVSKITGAVDVRASQLAGLRYLRIRPDRARLARYGLAVEDVNLVTESIAVGRPAGVVFEGDRRFDIVVKLATTFEGNVDIYRALPLKAANGQIVPLGDVADIRISTGPALVEREQLSRRATIEFNVRGRDMVSVVQEAKAAVEAQVPLPPGYRYEWGGQFQNYADARTRLMIVVPVVLALIMFVLWLAFREITPALLIFLNVPFAVVGGVFALYARDLPFSISAGVGFIALFGVAILNGLVLVTFSHHLESEGLSPSEAIARAATERLRPVLMTALVAALGFLPMALSTAPGSEVQRPLATVVIGGLISAAILTLFMLPATYGLVVRGRKIVKEVP